MSLTDNKELIIIIVGLILTITIYGSLIGLPMILIGAYFLNKKAKNPNQKDLDRVNDEIMKKEQLIQQYNELIGVNQTLTEKRQEINNINQRLTSLEQEKTKEIDQKLAFKNEQIQQMENKLNKMEEEKTREINQKLKQTELTLQQTNEQLTEKQAKLAEIENKYEITKKLSQRKEEINKLDKEIHDKQNQVGILDDTIEMQEYGIYEPLYNFTKSEEYKDKLKEIRDKQKKMVKDKQAAICTQEWTIDGNKRKGQAFVNQNLRQAIYTFNIECQQIISKTKATNITKQREKIQKVFERINKMNERNTIHINSKYLNLKYDELQLAIEYEMKKQEEKEILREAREREKEEKKVQKELERKEKEIEKQKTKLQKELEEAKLKEKEKAKNEEEKQALREQIRALEQQIAKQDEDKKDIENKRLRTGAGFVYIISNIGSFGEGVYKIGVTRRDDPEARVNELSNASVPFKYDVHAFIFSENAFDLETELHQKYNKQRVNKVNNRKEFFRLSQSDIEHIVKNNKNSTYNFTLQAEALEYYETLQIQKQQTQLI